MITRTNQQWIDDLNADGSAEQTDALENLRSRLYRGIFYYLSRDRSDLADRSHEELGQMAEDFAQEATLRVLKNLDSFRGESLFTTWATKVAVRAVVSELRRSRYRDFSLETLTVDGEVMTALDPHIATDQSASPEKNAERADVMEKVQYALENALTDRQRSALVAVGMNGIPLEIVAEQMQTNRNALYKLLHDARSKLKASLEKEGLSMEYIKDLFA